MAQTMSRSTLTFAAAGWLEANQRYLAAALALLRTTLELRFAPSPTGQTAHFQAQALLHEAAAALPEPSTLATLGTLFGLSSFERELLLLCAGIELDQNFADFYASLLGVAQPTYSVALAALPDAHWSALSPDAPLRRWRLLEMRTDKSIVNAPLRIDERILHYLNGVHYLAEPLVGYVRPAWESTRDLAPSHARLVDQVLQRWSAAAQATLPAICLYGATANKERIATVLAESLGQELYVMSAHLLPTAPHELDALMRLWEREAALRNSALLLECDDLDATDGARGHLLHRFAEEIACVLILADRRPRLLLRRPLLSMEIGKLSQPEQRLLWQQSLGDLAATLNGQVERVVTQFDLGAVQIEAAGRQVAEMVALDPFTPATAAESGAKREVDLTQQLWQACRTQARPQVDDLAQLIEPTATWADLVLPPRHLETLQTVALHLRQRHQVYTTWGFAAKSARGLGISALFAGPSGTGKTMAAEVLANELQLDLYRIDLSQVVSKYIGETEKNLRRVFDTAEVGGAILLFDEADALFGKRSEVKDSHDRYANIEVSYLLQRMEAYRGLAILTTNLKNALDDAFMRRIRFKVQFPFPDGAARAEIWRRIFPAQTPTTALDFGRLAQLNVAGGNIRNIALQAAFLAAEAAEPVAMHHLLQAAQAEYAKLEKPLPVGEIKGW